jgi:hypothetical protein
MGKDREIVSPPLTFDEFQNKAREIHSEEAKAHEGIFYWDNSDLYPNYESIPSETKTQFVLKQAQNNNTLEQIQEHFEPLVFTSNSGSIKLRVWKLSEIKSIAKNGSADGSARTKEFEVWISSSGYDITRKSIFDRLTSISGDSA